jgi:hypothetical protein
VQVQLVSQVTGFAAVDWSDVSVYGHVSESPLHDPPGVMAPAAGQLPTSLHAAIATATAAKKAAHRLELRMGHSCPGHCVTVSTPFIIM